MLLAINLKLIAREWKKMLLITFAATVLLFIGGGFESNDAAPLVFIFMFLGVFIGVNVFWSAGSAVYGFIVALGTLNKHKQELKEKSGRPDLSKKD